MPKRLIKLQHYLIGLNHNQKQVIHNNQLMIYSAIEPKVYVRVLPSDVHILQTLERRVHLSAQTLDAHTYAAIYLRNTPDNT